jgi:hypothetical protein
MNRKIRVTDRQIAAARAYVRISEKRNEEVDPVIRRIAQMRPPRLDSKFVELVYEPSSRTSVKNRADTSPGRP